MPGWDVIIVGAGSSGSALATRLCEDPDRRILLLESGADYVTHGDLPPELRSVNDMRASVPGNPHNWSFTGSLSPAINYPVARGRVTGGSGTINGGLYMRGTPADFDSWAALGNDAWSYERVLPAFRRSERDLDHGRDAAHGDAGPIPVRRTPVADHAAVSEAFHDDAVALGFPEDPDFNAPGSSGVGAIPLNVVDGVRFNAATAYLPAALHRSNFRLRCEATVVRVMIEGSRVTGVELEGGERILADEVILCAGAIKSPHLLLLSGIGPASDLRAAGVDVRIDLPGVGRDFTDHPDVIVSYTVDPSAVAAAPQTMFQLGLNLASPHSTGGDDLLILSTVVPMSTAMFRRASAGEGGGASAWRHPVRSLAALRGSSVGRIVRQLRQGANLGLMVTLVDEESRGSLSIVSADPGVQPRLRFDYLRAGDDRAKLRHGIRVAAELLEGRAFRRLGAKRTIPAPADLRDDARVDRWMDRSLATAYHSAGTASMGPDSDPLAVTDQYGRVRGVTGLRIADLSILPKVVRRGTNATAVMIGERIAELMDSSN